ncbi:MAG: hypothetical protein M3253_04445 [Chloroflexota bacterium]|nr:hypothetical protein [Chloroflexota bacterium]
MLLFAVLSVASGCRHDRQHHEIEATKTCLQAQGLRVQQGRKQPPQLNVYHPRSGEFVEALAFYKSRDAAAAEANRPLPRLAVPPREAINNVVIVGFWNDREEIRGCLKP